MISPNLSMILRLREYVLMLIRQILLQIAKNLERSQHEPFKYTTSRDQVHSLYHVREAHDHDRIRMRP